MKGVGKTSVVQTATEKKYGVVTIRVPAATPEATIVAEVLRAITRSHSRMMLGDISASTRRVLWWHRLMFRTPATVVLNAAERKPTQAFADLDSAARALADGYGLRVVIDACDNSLPEYAKATKREDVIEVGPMSRDVLESVPDLAELLSALKAADLADVVWACVGGVPADYLQLVKAWKKAGGPGADLEVVVERFVQKMLVKAIDNKTSNAALDPLYAKFRELNEVPSSTLKELNLIKARPSPDKTLRQLYLPGGKKSVLIPADAAMAIVLRFALTEAPMLQELKELLRSNPPPTAIG